MDFYSEFLNPSNQFRPIPFWSWNDKLEKEELKFQIRELKDAGMGGFFMHARSGLKTEYLGEEWFDCIRAGIDEAKEVGMQAWAYDEEGWPSGFAGGLVPALSSDYHAKFMNLEYHKDVQAIEKNGMIALYFYKEGTYRRILPEESVICGQGEELLLIRKHSNEFYIDTLNKRAVDAFLASTHELYYQRFGEDFGKHMHGFFTDEPRLICNHFGDLPWSDDLPGYFLEKQGYDIMEHIPALTLKTPGYEKYRYDFWEVVSDMFVQHYMKNIYDWCEAHHCKVTGHIMMEESIFSQMTSTAGVMPFYEYMHIPGIDWLRRMISSPVIGKQVGSAAAQLSKKQVITESFALCGWNVSFEELKWIAEWQFVNGVNQICQHLMGYTIRGVRKRDYPPSHFTQQSWWKESKGYHNYLSRLCVALSEGDQTADVLLLHPMRSGYVSFDGTRTEEIRKLDDEFIKASKALSGMHISYHYGDETLIKKHGSVEANAFRIGRVAYKTVVLPHMYAIDTKTLRLLLAFANQGGAVFYTGDFPYFTNGDARDLEELKQRSKGVSCEELRDRLLLEKRVTLSVEEDGKEVKQITCLQRETEDGSLIFFLVNHSQEEAFHANLHLLGKSGRLLRLIAETGDILPAAAESEGGDTSLSLCFEPMQSYLFMFEPEEAAMSPAPAAKLSFEEEQQVEITPGTDWKIEAMSENSLTLDYCTYRIDDGIEEGPIAVIHLQKKLLDLKRSCKVELKFNFKLDLDLGKNQVFDLVVEDAARYEVLVNGNEVSGHITGWWKDKSFHRVPIKQFIHSGSNEIVMKLIFQQPKKVYDVLYGENVYETELNKITYDVELESIYLVGDFGVFSETPFKKRERKALETAGPFVIKDRPSFFRHNEFTTEGLLFFAGDLMLYQEFTLKKERGKRVILNWKNQNAPLVKVLVNGKEVKSSFWAPYAADITDAAQDGVNQLAMHFFASNRNLLGPHHHIKGECYNVGPDSFTGKWSWVERESEADATDIPDRTKNFWTDHYCFVSFGLPDQT